MKPVLRIGPAITLEMQLICKCCGQPYHPDNSWEDRYRAVVFGAERFAICPVCTQAPSPEVFNRTEYRRPCLREVRRLQTLYVQAQKRKSKEGGHR